MAYMSYEKTCEACGEIMVMMEKPGGGWVPVDADTVDEGDEIFDPATHVSHFKTCTDPNRFSGRK